MRTRRSHLNFELEIRSVKGWDSAPARPTTSPFITSGSLSQWTWALWRYGVGEPGVPWRDNSSSSRGFKKIPELRWTALGIEGVYAGHGAALTAVREKFQGEPELLPTYRCPSKWLKRRRAIIQASHPFPKTATFLWREKKIRTWR